jgi:hypothetical protein
MFCGLLTVLRLLAIAIPALRKFSDQKLRVLTLILLLKVISLFNCLINRLPPLFFTLLL